MGWYWPDKDDEYFDDISSPLTPEEQRADMLRQQWEMDHRIPREIRIAYIAAADKILSWNTPEDWRD